MLSRVAESLYWVARYVERAEDISRLLDVDFHALLDAQVGDRDDAWHRLVALLGDEALYREHFDDFTAAHVSDWVLWHAGNPSSVASCITLARENARSVREQISGEMWEAVNGLFLLVRAADRQAISRGPSTFCQNVRNGAHLFQGAADATMIHGSPYDLIQLGFHLERAEKTVRAVAARYPAAAAFPVDEAARGQQSIALLRSCSAFEAYIKRHGTHVEPWPAADYLIRSDDFPRSVLFCLSTCLGSVGRISGDGGQPHRILGRLCAGLEFGDVSDVSGPAVYRMLSELLAGIAEVGEALTAAFFSSQALPIGSLYAQEAQQQQQQCG